MENYITIYITCNNLAELVRERFDDITRDNLSIEIEKNEIEIHLTQKADSVAMPPRNMSEFLKAFQDQIVCGAVDIEDSILNDILEISWSSALWTGDSVVETAEFEYDKKDGESSFSYSKGESKEEITTEEKQYAQAEITKAPAKKKREAPKGSTPQLSGEETPAELAEKWFDYVCAKCEALQDEIKESNIQYYSQIYLEHFGGARFTDESEVSFVRIAYSDAGEISQNLQRALNDIFEIDETALASITTPPIEEDYNAIKHAFASGKFEVAVDMLSSIFGFMFSDGKDHPQLIAALKPVFVESASKCGDLQKKTLDVDLSEVIRESYKNAAKSFELRDNGPTWTITGYIGKETVITIPGFIDEKPVYQIGDAAFSSEINKSRRKKLNTIEEVYMPNTIKSVGEDVFTGCKKLRKVVMSDALVSITDSSGFNTGFFAGCESLQEVILPKYLESIGACAFYWCASLESITLPPTLKKINSQAFAFCRKLNNVTLPESLTDIADRAFSSCDAFTEIVFPSQIKVIRQYTCSGQNLEKIVLPDGIEEVEPSAFATARNLRELVTPDKFVKWGHMAIDEDSPLYNHYGFDAEDPATALRYWNKNLFGYVARWSGKTIFPDIYIEEGTERIVSFAFSSVNNVERVHIPESVVDIDEDAFFMSPKIIICAAPGGIAEKYAKDNDMRFEAE